jgi:hypothetical protein
MTTVWEMDYGDGNKNKTMTRQMGNISFSIS